MPTTALQIIEAAYLRSTGFDAGKIGEDPELILHLNRLYDRYYTLLLRARPDRYGSLQDVILASGAAAITGDPLDILQITNALGDPVHLIAAADRHMLVHLAPAVYRLGTSLRTRGKTGDPVDGETLTLTVLAAPTPITALTTELDAIWPARHELLLIDALALYLSTKDEGREQEEHAKLEKEYAASMASFTAEFPTAPDAVEVRAGSRTQPHSAETT